MLDIDFIRKQPKKFDANIARRNVAPHAERILQLDEDVRAAMTDINRLNKEKNDVAERFRFAKDDAEKEALKETANNLKERIVKAEEAHKEVNDKLMYLLYTLPNMLLDEVPDGHDDTDNVEYKRWGTPREFNFKPKEHFELGEALGQMDFEVAAKLAGARFVVMKKGLAKLHRALGQFMLDTHVMEHGFTEVDVPIMVKTETMAATTHLPKFDNGYKTTDDYWLIPSAEVCLINLFRDTVLEETDVPIRVAALTPCFRSEAGAAGRDTRGMLRQHQFYKVELVTITHPDKWKENFEYIATCAENILQKLELPYRLNKLCAGDCATKEAYAVDPEVWLPGQNCYREICTWGCTTDYQTRRANIRMKDGKDKIYPYAIYGSGTAVGRALIAVMENYQQEDGTILIPKVLEPYMGGIKVIGRD